MLQQNSSKLLRFLKVDRTLRQIITSKWIKSVGCNDEDSFKCYSIKACHALSSQDSESKLHDKTHDLTTVHIGKILDKFYSNERIKNVLSSKGLNGHIQYEIAESFRSYCTANHSLPHDLHAVLSSGNHAEILSYFLNFVKEVFPHFKYTEGIDETPDLRNPAQWYQEARSRKRKIVFHTGPTNSGKTYQAFQRFLKAKSGVYCGPLKLLASEVYTKSNKEGTPCDLVTGEEKNFMVCEERPSPHMACTIEMTPTGTPYEVAVIDEIQMIGDTSRGWAWTRALLGVNANEVHLCGEEGAANLIYDICSTIGETVEIKKYNSLTKFEIQNSALGSFSSIQPGDCVVCFSKEDIYNVSRTIENLGKEVAVIYGDLPPNTKLMQAKKFNDPKNSCKVLVATDAIGMGLNLSIRRIIFYSIKKMVTNLNGETKLRTISVSQALQIAGRAGRLGTRWKKGLVTTYKEGDLSTLKYILSQQPEPITKAGLYPTPNHIETYSYRLPNSSLSNLMNKFVDTSVIDSLYFMCNMKTGKYLANLIEDVSLPLLVRYKFCCAPVTIKTRFLRDMFLQFAEKFSKDEPIRVSWLLNKIGWPLQVPSTVEELESLQDIFDILDLYLWLSNHFEDIFLEANLVRGFKFKLEGNIENSVIRLTKLNTALKFSITSRIGDLLNDKFDANKQIFKDESSRNKLLSNELLARGLLSPQILLQNNERKCH